MANDTNWQRITVLPSLTGSARFVDMGTAYGSIQVTPISAASSYQSLTLYKSNVGPREHDASIPGMPNTPVTSSQHDYVWVKDPTVSGSLAASAFLTSSFIELPPTAAKYIKVDIASATGGDFVVTFNRKD